MNDQTGLLIQVVSVLESISVPYMIGGSVALAVWAGPRPTHDIALVIDMPYERIPQFCAQFQPDRYQLRSNARSI